MHFKYIQKKLISRFWFSLYLLRYYQLFSCVYLYLNNTRGEVTENSNMVKDRMLLLLHRFFALELLSYWYMALSNLVSQALSP